MLMKQFPFCDCCLRFSPTAFRIGNIFVLGVVSQSCLLSLMNTLGKWLYLIHRHKRTLTNISGLISVFCNQCPITRNYEHMAYRQGITMNVIDGVLVYLSISTR